MVRAPRNAALALLAGLALLAAGCESNNKGKIEGKWKLVSFPEKTDAKTKSDMAQMTEAGVYMYFEFKPGGTITIGVGADKPGVLDLIKAGAPGGQITWDAKYKLLPGDKVEVYDLPKEAQSGGGGLFGAKDRGRVNIRINGDSMTMTDEQGTGTLARMK